MEPERLEFLGRFDKFYQVLVNSLKERKIDERDFYLLTIAKAKDMDRERREKKKRAFSKREVNESGKKVDNLKT